VPDFAVMTVFKSRDGVTSVFKRMGAAADKFGKKSKISFDTANRSGLNFKKTLGAILSAGVISRGFGLMTRGARAVAEEFVTFDDALTRAGAKFPQMVTRGSAGFRQLEMVARDVGAKTKFSATEAAEGLDFLAMAGFNAEQAMAALPQVTNLAVVAGEDLARSTDIASDALGSFGLMTKDSAQLTENLTRINDVFAKTVTSANVDMEMLFETMKDGGPVMTAAGASIETFAALTGMMGSAGIKGTKAGTTLKNMFLALQAPVPKAQKLMKKLGLEIIDNEGKLKDITEILGDFNKATSKMGKAQKSAAINTIFGKRAIAGVSVLLAEGQDKMNAYRQTLIDSGGAAQTMADTIGKSLGNRLKALRSAAIELGFKFIDAFKKDIPGSIDGAVAAVRKFNVKPIVEGFKTFVGIVKKTIAVVKFLEPVIWTLIVAKIAYVAVSKTMVAIDAIKWFLGLAKATQSATLTQGALNAAMAANPVAVVILALAALGVAIYMIYRQWDDVKEIFGFVVDEFMDGMRAMGRAFSAFGTDIVTKWQNVKILFRDAWEGFKLSAADSVKVVKEKWETLRIFFRDLWAGIKAQFTAVFDSIGNAIRSTIGRVRNLINVIPGVDIGEGETVGAPGREAPNAAEVAAQRIAFRGKLTVAGAPEGSTLETETVGAPPIQTELLGANL
jgi:TP901 family phage tail tape measure protein